VHDGKIVMMQSNDGGPSRVPRLGEKGKSVVNRYGTRIDRHGQFPFWETWLET